MKLPTFRKMNLFRKRDKQKNGSAADGKQNYPGYGSSNAPSFSISEADLPANDSNSSRSRHFKGLKGFGGGGGSSSNGRRSASDPTTGAAVSGTSTSARLLQTFPDAVLARVFAFVCPHSQDRSYEKCEDSTFGECMLCDMRDLAHCVQVCRRWRPVAEEVLYTSIRIDTVHYCAREGLLADKRKRRSFFDRNAEPEDTPDARLKLLCRTLRDGPTHRLGQHVQFLKLPYMLRESRHVDIARTVSVLSNLRYVDLPEGLFMDEPLYLTLKIELEAKCHDLRKMTYMGGAENSLEALSSGNRWRFLEVLELVKINVDPVMLRHVLCLMTELKALKVTELPAGPHSFSGDALAAPAVDDGPDGPLHEFYTILPPLEELVLTNAKLLTTAGLLSYMKAWHESARSLKVLTLKNTGVKPWELRAILDLAVNLRHLTVVDEVTVALPVAANTKDIQPLASTSLRTLNYEIAPAQGVSPYAGVTRSYYNYLSGSILSGGLPNLRAVYVRDAQFPESLLGDLPLPGPIGGAAFGEFGGGNNNRRPASASASSTSGTASALNSPMSTGSIGQLHSPMNFLSPHQSPGVPPSAAVPRTLPTSPITNNNNNNNNNMRTAPTNPFLDPNAPQSPPKPWAAGHNPRFSSNNPFAGMISPQKVQTLEVFTKGDNENDWSSIIVGDGDNHFLGGLSGGNGSSSRPVSSYGLGADLGTVGARKSVLISMGPGNFLAVPDAEGGGSGGGGRTGGVGGSGLGTTLSTSPGHAGGNGQGPDLWPRPVSAGERRSEKLDLWR